MRTLEIDSEYFICSPSDFFVGEGDILWWEKGVAAYTWTPTLELFW